MRAALGMVSDAEADAILQWYAAQPAGEAQMNIVGKLIGALIGLFCSRTACWAPWSAWRSGICGTSACCRCRAPSARGSHSFIAPLFGLAGAISKSDGRVSEGEITATENLMDRMQLSSAQREEAISHFNQGKHPDFRTTAAIADLKAWASGRRDLAYLLLDMLLDIVYAEGAPLQTDKLRIVRKLCWSLNVDERELSALAAMKGYGFAYQRGYTYGNRYGIGRRPALRTGHAHRSGRQGSVRDPRPHAATPATARSSAPTAS